MPKAEAIRFRYIPENGEWAVFLPQVGKETFTSASFLEAAKYALFNHRPGQRIEWPPSEQLRQHP